MMDMGMGGGTDYSPLYAQAKEILAAGMLAELKEDAQEAMGQGEDQGGEDMCPHCGAPMGGPMGNPMAVPRLAPAPAPAGPMGLPPELAMRVPAPSGPLPSPAGIPMPPMRMGT
jgi:hypothetical protein